MWAWSQIERVLFRLRLSSRSREDKFVDSYFKNTSFQKLGSETELSKPFEKRQTIKIKLKMAESSCIENSENNSFNNYYLIHGCIIKLIMADWDNKMALNNARNSHLIPIWMNRTIVWAYSISLLKLSFSILSTSHVTIIEPIISQSLVIPEKLTSFASLHLDW